MIAGISSIGISSIGKSTSLPPIAPTQGSDGTVSTEPFQKMLGDAVGSLDRLQSEADTSAAKLAAGEPVELHEVLLATEKASLSFQLAVQVRNKVVEAYQDVMRMQV